MWILLALLIVLAACTLLVVWKLRSRRALTAGQRQAILSQWKGVEAQRDSHRRVLDAEKVFAQALAMLRYDGSIGDVLKEAGPRFRDVESLWRAHKLRNRIAHETNVTVTDDDAAAALAAFRRGMDDLS